MKRIAAPMIGGMVSSTLLTLLVIPTLYALWRSRSLHYPEPVRRGGSGADGHSGAIQTEDTETDKECKPVPST
jgi:hypothetical protein